MTWQHLWQATTVLPKTAKHTNEPGFSKTGHMNELRPTPAMQAWMQLGERHERALPRCSSASYSPTTNMWGIHTMPYTPSSYDVRLRCSPRAIKGASVGCTDATHERGMDS